jgi:CHAT domain-containing protein/tetratricopeptide (TPR) repeat protein
MRRILISLLLSGLIGSTGALAAPPQAPTETAADAELSGRLDSLRQTTDLEQRIALGEQLLAAPPGAAQDAQGVPHGSVRAQIEFEVGNAYLARPRGEHADNIEQAITHLQAALSNWDKETGSADWAAHAHNNLAIAYTNRIRGEKAANLELAISHLEAAEPVLSREVSPQEWAQLQNNFAVVYLGRLTGDHAANLETAIKHFEAGLTVVTKDADPYRWATIQHNLASAYTARKTGARVENQRKAMAHIEAALSVFTREAFPNEWAQSQQILGIAYHERIEGDREDNQDQALVHYEQALTVFGRETKPEDWAQLQQDIGIAYSGRTKGAQAENRRKAIAAFEDALTIFTRDAYPADHLRTARLLGSTLLQAGELKKASLAQEHAREAFLVLLGQGPEEAETRSLIADAGPLFSESAFTAAQLGDGERALMLANEGRARLLTVAMRMQPLKLGEGEQLHLDELRGAIRVARHTADTTRGSDRTTALAQLVALRQQVLQLVQAGETHAQSAMKEAHAVAASGGAVAVPIITAQGAKLLVMTKGGFVSIVDLPELTTARLQQVLIGAGSGEVLGGWLGAYFVNYLSGDEMQKRWPEWLGAIDGLGPELWRLVGASLDATLKQRGVAPGARLVWLPSGWLGTLPLGLAQNPVNKRRLVDDYEIVYAQNLEALAASEDAIAATGAPTLTAIVNPTGDLPGTEKEGAIVVAHFQPSARTVLEGDAATPAAVLAALKGRTHWHFASHGGFSWLDPRQSGLLLHGPAKLTVSELADAEGLGHPRLVVLSACETGLYDLTSSPDEFIGLPGTFTALGAAGVLGTLWPVSDAATALLIGKFYELHIENGASPPAALRGAQLWLREATSEDLEGFAKVASARGLLPSRHLAEIEAALSGKGEEHPRSLTGSESGAVTGSVGEQRPYENPYFWAGFIYTGF